MNKVVTIGDSFCTSFDGYKPRPNEEKYFWVSELQKLMPSYNFITDGQPSRDIQTVIDHWIKCIPKMNQDDYLIICLPVFKRTRLPLQEDCFMKVWNDENRSVFLEGKFVGTNSYEYFMHKLEFWGNEYKRIHFIDNLEYQEIINGSKANQLNQLEIIGSLVQITKCNLYIFSWDNFEYKSTYIEDREILEKKVGKWETHSDVHTETNGEYGQLGDCHWSFTYNKLFAEYVYKKIKENNLVKFEKKIL